MTLEEKIKDKTIIYQVKYDKEIAIELAHLFLQLAIRKNCKQKIAAACQCAIRWLKEAGVKLPEYIERLSPTGQLEELSAILANAKVELS